MKIFSKIHRTNSLFISVNILTLLSLYKVSKASPNRFKKPSTVKLLSEVFQNPSEGFLQRLPNGKLKANFFYSNIASCLRNFSIKSGSSVYTKKNHDEKYIYTTSEKPKRKVIAEGVAFKVLTSSKSGLEKKIEITEENNNIIVTSQKGIGTPNQIFKKTILNFGDGPSTSSQTSVSSPTPKIISTKYSSFDMLSKKFNVETENEYDPSNAKLLSHISKNNSTGIIESTIVHEDDIETKIIENSNGTEKSFVVNKFKEILLTKTIDSNRNTTITQKVGHPDKFSTKIYNSNQILLEETNTEKNFYENKTYDENGKLVVTTTMNRLEDGSMLGTSISQTSSITYEKRSNGSLISTITRTSNGDLFKQDFDINNAPINNPYKIN